MEHFWQVKPDSKPYQVPPRCIACALQKPFKEELEWLQQHDIITPLGVDETVEGCDSFVPLYQNLMQRSAVLRPHKAELGTYKTSP